MNLKEIDSYKLFKNHNMILNRHIDTRWVHRKSYMIPVIL